MPDGEDYKECNDQDDSSYDANYGERGLDELIKFINGDGKQSDNKLSSKAAKRARQKQRKVCIILKWKPSKAWKKGGRGKLVLRPI